MVKKLIDKWKAECERLSGMLQSNGSPCWNDPEQRVQVMVKYNTLQQCIRDAQEAMNDR